MSEAQFWKLLHKMYPSCIQHTEVFIYPFAVQIKPENTCFFITNFYTSIRIPDNNLHLLKWGWLGSWDGTSLTNILHISAPEYSQPYKGMTDVKQIDVYYCSGNHC